MSLTHLRSLVEVARRGSISGAADALALSQPALTRRIQLLERELGGELVVRSRRGVALTDLGRQVEAEGRALLDRYERLKENARAHLHLERGTVRVGGGATAVSLLLPDVIRSFRRTHPEIVFHLKEAGSRTVEHDVLRDEVELGIVTLPVAARELQVTPLCRDRIVVIASRRHPLARRRRIPPTALDGMAAVAFEAGSAIRERIDRALQEHGVSVRTVMELRSIQSIVRMVGLELGLGFVSRLGVEEGDRRVAVLAVSGLRITRTLAVITRKDRPRSVAAQAFLDLLLADAGSRGGRGAR
ncbi:MAG: LysR substrate-binding domain-containing protein [Planctomycetota bacterium]